MDNLSPEIPEPLIEAARAGDREAAAELVERIYPLIGARVRNQIRRRDDIDDVIQEVILKMLLKLGQYRGPQPLEHWVGRLTVTTCYDWLRRQKARPAVLAADLSEPERELLQRSAGSGGLPADGTGQDLLAGLLDKLIATLHPREQIVIRMLDLEERPVKEIAALTGWGESKIKVTAHRARRKLGERLQQLEKPR